MFRAYRVRGAPIGLAPDPRTAHECGDSRYLAIPFFDACLAMRLPERGSKTQALRPIDKGQAWLALPLGERAEPAESYQGEKSEAVWLPNERVARAWQEYVKSGVVSDTTPLAPPYGVRVAATPDGATAITWDAAADFESGLKAFAIERDGQEIGQVPEMPRGRFGRPLFQGLSYHDTPEKPLAQMRFIDRSADAGPLRQYRVISINSVGLRSDPSAPASP